MGQMKKITARINKRTGVITIQTDGFTGEACLLATKKLRDGLGITDEPDRTSEFYAEDTTTEQQQQGN